jgi:polysaccharide pyruvyl transferase CsaB
MKIVLSGYYGFDNAGDEALLAAITTSIKKLAPEAEFVVFSGSPTRTFTLHGIRAVYYLHPLHIIRELLSADLLISGGGSIFQDVTSVRSLTYYISVVALAKFLGKPVIFYAQGIGPINHAFSKYLMRLVANQVNLISLRDEDSRQYLLNLGVTRAPLIVTADPVFSLEPEDQDKLEMSGLLQELGVTGQPKVGVSVRQWPALEGHQSELARMLDGLAQKGFHIIFIPMAYPEDIAASRKVIDLMQEPAVLVNRHLKSQEHLAFIANLDLLIGMRLHALIFAASRGVPFAGISYDPKIDAFLKMFNLTPLAADAPTMSQQIQNLLEDNAWLNQLKNRSMQMRARAEENARLALSLVKVQKN